LCCCDYRVVLRCASHPPRAGGKKTKLDPGGSGLGQALWPGRPGELGQGGDSAFRPREARSRSKIARATRLLRTAQKVLVCSGDSASVVRRRLSPRPPRPSPARHAPTFLLPPARFPTRSPALTGRPAGAAWSKRPRRALPRPLRTHLPLTSSPLSHPLTC